MVLTLIICLALPTTLQGRITYRFRPGEYEALQNSQAQGQQS